jgi:hypothetical protein
MNLEDDELMFADGFDSCIIGILKIDDFSHVVYDKYEMVNVVRNQDPDMSYEDALEFCEYNVWGSYVGPNTPIYMYTFEGSAEEKKADILDYWYDSLE